MHGSHGNIAMVTRLHFGPLSMQYADLNILLDVDTKDPSGAEKYDNTLGEKCFTEVNTGHEREYPTVKPTREGNSYKLIYLSTSIFFVDLFVCSPVLLAELSSTRSL
ncbi:hypothetical protein OPV22_011132 [Ensete ventricosum]|uniref:Uncharacterized protein n=1 Tax=Ensete ventricosum TaxID=4639 RepID=A0AAV8RF01_ENSVE|nr:hypothetical protein OPV22_011132 [Ensete ventricosum]